MSSDSTSLPGNDLPNAPSDQPALRGNADGAAKPATELLQAVARGWCHEKNARKEMDPDLAISIAAEVSAWLDGRSPEGAPPDGKKDAWLPIASAPKGGLVDVWAFERRYTDCWRDPVCSEYRTLGNNKALVTLPLAKCSHWMYPPSPPASAGMPERLEERDAERLAVAGASKPNEQNPAVAVSPALADEALLRRALEVGWKMAAEWANRDDLLADMDSPKFIIERDNELAALRASLPTPPSSAQKE